MAYYVELDVSLKETAIRLGHADEARRLPGPGGGGGRTGHPRHPTKGLDGPGLLPGLDDGEPLHLWLAKKAVAFSHPAYFKISRSSSRPRFSLRRRALFGISRGSVEFDASLLNVIMRARH